MPSDAPPLVPRKELFGNPDKVQPRISPDGTRLAYVGPRDGVLNVWVGELGAPEQSFRAVTDDADRGIRRGIDHEYFLLPDEGHTLVKPENRLRVTAATERFLAKHLGGRYER